MTIRRFSSPRESLLQARLYLILGTTARASRDSVEVAAAAVRGGVELIQVRLKEANTGERVEFCLRLAERCGETGPPIIVNDDLEAALEAGAAGVHVGQEDLPVAEVRRRAGDRLLVGLSTHSVAQAEKAEAIGADYAGFGAMFPTPTKEVEHLIGPEALTGLTSRVDIPVFAIGGITLSNLDRILRAGCRRVAVSSAILEAADPEAAARAFHERLWDSGPVRR